MNEPTTHEPEYFLPPPPKRPERVMLTVRVPPELAWRFRDQTAAWRLVQNDVLCSLVEAFVEDREAAAQGAGGVPPAAEGLGAGDAQAERGNAIF